MAFAAALTFVSAADSARAATRQESIFDPHFKMAAFDVFVPANWKFEGVYVPGTSCANIPFPVFRAYSPDGLTELRRYPRLDWTWNNISTASAAQHPDCLNLKQELTAQEFVKYIMGVLEMAYVRDAAVPPQVIAAKQRFLDQLNAQSAANARILKMEGTVQTAGFAAAYAQYVNGSFTIEAHVNTEVDCTRTPLPAFNRKGVFIETCSATVRVIRAPKGQLASVLSLFETQKTGAFPNDQWMQRYLTEVRQKAEQAAQQRHEEFERGQAIRAQQHQQFLATLQAGTDRSMARAQQAANARHAIAADWCDYALDQQTVTGLGGTVKISSAYTHTSTDGSGHYYQTNNPNANPNGVMPGNWTQTQKVHGDGTPY